MAITSILYNECLRRRCVTKKGNVVQVEFYNVDSLSPVPVSVSVSFCLFTSMPACNCLFSFLFLCHAVPPPPTPISLSLFLSLPPSPLSLFLSIIYEQRARTHQSFCYMHFIFTPFLGPPFSSASLGRSKSQKQTFYNTSTS